MWISLHSVEDEDFPYTDDVVRVEIHSFVMLMRPNKKINGYTII